MVTCDGTGRKIGFLERVFRTPDGKVYCEEYVQQMKEENEAKESINVPETKPVELPKTDKWEFQVVKLTPPKDRSAVSIEKIEGVINDQGDQGWELVSVVPVNLLLMQQGQSNVPALIFKRPKKKSSYNDSSISFA